MVRDLMRRLAELEPGELPVISAYLDLRPQATGQNPAVRSGLIVLKDRLREIEKTLGPRGEALESFQADAARIESYLEEQLSPAAQGLALFACADRELFEAVESGVAFENQVAVGPAPALFQLARLLDEQETAVIALVDTNTARLFVTRLGRLEEVGGPDDDSVHYRKRSTGGWSEARYQRHIDKHRADFAREAAVEIERLVDQEGAVRLILAGDEVAIPTLQEALSPNLAQLAADEVPRVDIRASRDELEQTVASILAQAESEAALGTADRLVGAVRADGLGVAGLERTRRALEYGQADVLVLADKAELRADARDELIRRAAQTGAEIEVVEGHEALERLGGVGALLRYRAPGAPVS
jgi:peptide chain release factor subunit 1